MLSSLVSLRTVLESSDIFRRAHLGMARKREKRKGRYQKKKTCAKTTNDCLKKKTQKFEKFETVTGKNARQQTPFRFPLFVLFARVRDWPSQIESCYVFLPRSSTSTAMDSPRRNDALDLCALLTVTFCARPFFCFSYCPWLCFVIPFVVAVRFVMKESPCVRVSAGYRVLLFPPPSDRRLLSLLQLQLRCRVCVCATACASC